MSVRELTEEDLELGAARALGPSLPSGDGWPVVDEVARAFHVTVDAIMGRDRSRHVSRARKAAFAALNDRLGWGPTRVGQFMGRDHTTVLQGIADHRARGATH